MKKHLFFILLVLLANTSFAQCWQSISAGDHFTIATQTNGTLWAWGDNPYGQLGDGTTTDKRVPTQIGTSTDWKTVSAGYYHSFAIKNDGTLWAWGENRIANLGEGNTELK